MSYRLLRRLRPEDDEDEVDHDEWTSDMKKAALSKIARLLKKRKNGIKWR